MIRFILAGFTLLLLSSCAWYSEYGIESKENLRSVNALPAFIKALESNKSKHVIGAANALLDMQGDATKAVPALVNAAEKNMQKKDVYNSTVTALIKITGEDSNEVKRLILLGISSEDKNTKIQTIQYAAQKNLISTEILEYLEQLSKHERDTSIRRHASSAYGKLKMASILTKVNNKQEKKLDFTQFVKNTPMLGNENSIAVVIGNKNYASNKGLPNVDFAQNDAKIIYSYLIAALGYREGNILLLNDAKQADILSLFGTKENSRGKLYNLVRTDESNVFVYYSGHGAPSLSEGTGYLLPVDADPSTVEINGYALNVLYDNLAKIPAKNITVVIDACFSGSSQGGSIIKHASSISLKPVNLPKNENKKINIISATDIGEVASWDLQNKQGLLTYYFIKGITGDADDQLYGNGDKKVQLDELQRFLRKEVPYMARRLYGRDQFPQVISNNNVVLSELGK